MPRRTCKLIATFKCSSRSFPSPRPRIPNETRRGPFLSRSGIVSFRTAPRRSVGKLGRWWPSFATDFLLIGRRETTSVSSLLIRSSTDSSGEIIISFGNPGDSFVLTSSHSLQNLFRQIYIFKIYFYASKKCFSFFFVRKYFIFKTV